MQLYVVTKKAPPVVAGRRHIGAGALMLLSDAEAAEPLAAKHIKRKTIKPAKRKRAAKSKSSG